MKAFLFGFMTYTIWVRLFTNTIITIKNKTPCKHREAETHTNKTDTKYEEYFEDCHITNSIMIYDLTFCQHPGIGNPSGPCLERRNGEEQKQL